MASQQRELRCSLKKCSHGELRSTVTRVEVRGFDVSAKEIRDMKASWQENGEAVFHDTCWKSMTDSMKKDSPFTLIQKEKELVQEAKKTAEHFDSHERVEAEGIRVARLLKKSKYAISFTGAGISTSAGIGDYRGKSGKWTERDRQKAHGVSKAKRRGTAYHELRPTYTHEALCKLVELGYIKHIISQNTDGLHRLSGIPRADLSELHGNGFQEKCEKCNARYERPASISRAGYGVPPKVCDHCHIDHRTGGVCEMKGCGGYLMNTIINFGDNLEGDVLHRAEQEAKKNDLCLCLGTTLRVTPACDLVEMGDDPVRLVICNRQPTPFDQVCYDRVKKEDDPNGSRVFGDCDHLMRVIMSRMLSPEDLEEWEEGREDRLKKYAKQRQAHL